MPTVFKLHSAHPNTGPGVDKLMVQQLLSLAQSNRQRECIRYTVFRASGMSQTQACKTYGFQI